MYINSRIYLRPIPNKKNWKKLIQNKMLFSVKNSLKKQNSTFQSNTSKEDVKIQQVKKGECDPCLLCEIVAIWKICYILQGYKRNCCREVEHKCYYCDCQ